VATQQSLTPAPSLSCQNWRELDAPHLPREQLGERLAQTGKCCYEQEQYAAAARVWQETAEAFKTQPDLLNQAMALSNLSLTYQQLGQWVEAKAAITVSLQLLTENNQVISLHQQTDASKKILASSLDIKGKLEFAIGKPEVALATWQKAAEIYQQIGEDKEEIQNVLNQVQAMVELGDYLPAKRLLERLKDTLDSTTDLELKVTGWLSLSNVLRKLGEFTESQQLLHQTLKLATTLEQPELIGAVKLDLGNTEQALWQKAKAIGKEKDPKPSRNLESAKTLYQDAAQVPKTKLQAQLNLLNLLLETEESSNLQTLLPEIEHHLEQIVPSRSGVIAQIYFANSLMKLRKIETKKGTKPTVDIAKIAQYLATAVQQSRNLQDKRIESLALGSLGELYHTDKQQNNALELTQQALTLAQEISASDISYRWQWQIGRLLKQQGKIEKAIQHYTAAVANLDAIRRDLLPANPEVQFSFRDSVEPVYRELVDLLLRTDGETKPSQVQLKLAIEQINNLQLAELENFLSCNPETFIKLYKTNDWITDPKAAIIYPIILETKLAIILQLPEQKLKYYETMVPGITIEKTLKKLQTFLAASDGEPDVIIQSQEIYHWLMKPLIPDLEKNQQIETLVFVPDGVLRNIPMGVLYDQEQGNYLLQNYAIAIAPRLQIFAPQPTPQNLDVLTGGVGIKQEENDLRFEPIKELEAELKPISEITQSNPPILNKDFTKNNIKKQLSAGNFSGIHIKTHGEFSSDTEETFIVAYQEKISSKDFANLIQLGGKEKTKPLELLVLSACKTAAGDNRAVLGLAGIAVRLGSRSALSSLWIAQDARNTELMKQFYTELLISGKSKAKALQMAQLSLLKQGYSSHIWANYILVGNWL
jgi:CHAT domain-containing protein